nr:MAG TPA: hypothetical protein [Caudoviricetes sp.]DAV87280.1 MAG TPA: hypothetical protein [Caudoviricetes sp.]
MLSRLIVIFYVFLYTFTPRLRQNYAEFRRKLRQNKESKYGNNP